MKKVLSIFAVAILFSAATFAQKAVIKFKVTEHDFAKVEQGKPASFTFEFTNTGTNPLILGNVTASCGCTTPDWTKEPILPGKTGKVTATYNALNAGAFNKAVTVPSNAENGTVTLTLKGEVVAAAAKTGGR